MLLIAAVIAVFAGQNAHVVDVRFLGWGAETSLVVVIVFAAAAGGILVGIASLWRQLQAGLHTREVSSRLNRLEKERDELIAEREGLREQVDTLQHAVKEMSSRESGQTTDQTSTRPEAEEKPSSSGA